MRLRFATVLLLCACTKSTTPSPATESPPPTAPEVVGPPRRSPGVSAVTSVMRTQRWRASSGSEVAHSRVALPSDRMRSTRARPSRP